MDGTPAHQNLTERQEHILRLVARGHTNTEIADELGISLNGVKWHIRELFSKYGVDSREELSEAWQESRRPVNRMRGWARGLAFGLPLKVTAGGTAATVVLGVAAGAVIAFVNLDPPPAAEAGKETKQTATAVPTEMATPTIETPRVLIVPPGSRIDVQQTHISADDYRVVIEQVEQALMQSGLGRESTRGVYTIHDLLLERAEWIPDIAGDWDLGDDDHYLPAPEDGQTRDLYRIQWRVADVPLLSRPGVADFVLTAVYEAGHPEAAWWHYEFGRSYGATLNSRNSEAFDVDAIRRLHSEPSGDPVFLAHRDNLEGERWIATYPTRSGEWCLAAYEGQEQRNRMCTFVRSEPVQFFGNVSHIDRDGNYLDKSLLVATSPEITSIQVVSDAFEPRTYETQVIPGELPFEGRVAYVTLLPSPRSFVVIGYNEAGEEVARKGSWP